MSKNIQGQSPELLLKRAILDIKELRSKLSILEREKSESIAIIGMGCRFPGNATSPEEFWRVLVQGVDAIHEVPADRWDARAYYDPDPDIPGKMSTCWGGFLEHVDAFDAAFFGISPREAAWIDPQQRLALEVAWEALEDAGLVLSHLAGSRTGVFMGIGGNDYASERFADLTLLDAYAATGNAHSIAANRLSYLFDFRGPSVAVDTACSSSLVTVHLACRSLRDKDCDLALAGGVNLILSPPASIMFSKSHMMAADGRCKTFDARADGYVRGEGCGIIVLKRFSEALADKDHILAIIRGSAVNQDGRTNGLMAPNGVSQRAVLRQALENANVSPAQVSYIEAHGTGTLLGDSIEMKALLDVYQQGRSALQPCRVGSVKTNIGHLEIAAGIAGLIKVILSLQHKTIPPNLHLHQLNPNITLEQTAFSIPTTCQEWPEHGGPRIGAVSSFGFGGTNAHLILEAPFVEEPGPQLEEHARKRLYLLPLSARSPRALSDLAQAYCERLLHLDPPPDVYDICYTASVRRMHHAHRLAVQGRTGRELAANLAPFFKGEHISTLPPAAAEINQLPKLVFVYSGQGGQWAGMGKLLLEREALFYEAILQCDRLLQQFTSRSLLSDLQSAEDDSHFGDTEIAQPAIFAIQVALTNLWQSWGIVPEIVIGHSMGEVAAAHVAGILSLEDAIRIIFYRGHLMQQATGRGRMLEVNLTKQEADHLLTQYKQSLSIAAINSPSTLVFAGEVNAVQDVSELMRERGVFARLLPVNYAFHSPQMDPFLPAFLQAIDPVEPRAGHIPFYSTVSGRSAAGEINARYWANNMRNPVLFASAVDALLREQSGSATFLEVGPHPVLAKALKQCQDAIGGHGNILPSLRRSQNEQAVLLSSLAALYTLGHSVDWHKFHPQAGDRITLPTYPWQRQRFWVEPSGGNRVNKDGEAPPAFPAPSHKQDNVSCYHPLLGQRIHSPLLRDYLYQAQWNVDSPGFLKDHRIYTKVIVPAVAYLEMILAAALEIFDAKRTIVLENIAIQEPLSIPQEGGSTVQLILTKTDAETFAFQVCSQVTKEKEITWKTHATGRVFPQKITSIKHEPFPEQTNIGNKKEIPVAAYYQTLGERGFEYGPGFRGIQKLWSTGAESLGRVSLPDPLASEAALYQIHPCLLEACLQVAGAPVALSRTVSDEVSIPIAIDRIYFYGSGETTLWSYSQLQPGGSQEKFQSDVHIRNSGGQQVMDVLGLHVRRAKRQALTSASLEWLRDMLYEVRWRKEEPVQLESGGTDLKGPWLIFADPDGIGEACAKLLRGAGHVCHNVFPGERYQIVQRGYYRVNPAQSQDFQRLLADVLGAGRTGSLQILHLWSLRIAAVEDGSGKSLEDGQLLGCGSILHVLQALSGKDLLGAAKMWLVTRGSQVVNSVESVEEVEEKIAPEQAPLWGLGKVIALEHPEVWGGLIDLNHALRDPEIEAAALLQEVKRDDHFLLAVRGGQRYSASLVRSKIQKIRQESFTLSSEGTYLITGGLGGLGMKFAQWMIERGAKHLVLVGRKKPSPEIAEIIQEWEVMGVKVHVAQNDVTQYEGVAALFEAIGKSMPALRGLIHAAGVLDDGILLQQNWSRFTNVMAPKVIGAWNLHLLTQTIPLDFFVVFSSAASVLGSPGQGNYAAANAFLDSLAYYRKQQGLPALSINWGPWSEVGMAAVDHRNERGRTQEGILSIAPGQGIEAFEWLLSQVLGQVAVVPIQWTSLFQRIAGERIPALLSSIAQEVQSKERDERSDAKRHELLHRLEQAHPARRQRILEECIRAQISRNLGFSDAAEIEAQRGFFDLGMDSLMAIELKSWLEASLNCSLPPTLIFDYPTIASLSKYLVEKFAPPASGLSSASAQAETGNGEDTLLAKLEGLSEDEAIALLEEKLSMEGF